MATLLRLTADWWKVSEDATEGETGRCQTASTDSAGTRMTTEKRRGRLGRKILVLAPISPRGLAPRT